LRRHTQALNVFQGEYEREEAEELIAFVEEAVKFVENLRGKAKT
jgi:HEPN domain-containing protein